MDATTLFGAVDLSTVAASLGGLLVIGLGFRVGGTIYKNIMAAVGKVRM